MFANKITEYDPINARQAKKLDFSKYLVEREKVVDLDQVSETPEEAAEWEDEEDEYYDAEDEEVEAEIEQIIGAL